jgi:hypothetical protein
MVGIPFYTSLPIHTKIGSARKWPMRAGDVLQAQELVEKLNKEFPTNTSVQVYTQTVLCYFCVTKAVNAKGRESNASNEVRADIPPP